MKKETIIYIGLGLTAVVLAGIVFKKWKTTPAKKGEAWINPVDGKLTSPFGYRKDPTRPEKKQLHNGQDIAAPIGTPVKSPRDGKIKSATSTEAGGNTIIEQFDNNYFGGYAHLSRILVKKDQFVKKGEVIGLVGNTGAHTTGPHLHLTVTDPKGNKINPKEVMYKQKAA